MNSGLTAQYGEVKKLALLNDSSTYFSLLARDIRRYCLAPLLMEEVMSCPPIKEWQPRSQVQLQRVGWRIDRKIQDFLVLRNGDFLVICDGFIRCRPFTGQIVYQLFCGACLSSYDYPSDTLIVSIDPHSFDSVKMFVPQISEILTAHQLKQHLILTSFENSSEQWSLINRSIANRQFLHSQVLAYKQISASPRPYDYPPPKSGYYNGFLIIHHPSVYDHATSVFEFHQVRR